MPSFYNFRGSYRCVRIALSVAVANGFIPRKVLDVRITGRFAKRFSGERPVSLGFELTFLSEFK